MCLVPSVCFAYKGTFEVKVGDKITCDGGSYRYIQAVLWDYDASIVEASSVSGYSTRGVFKAIKPSPSAGTIIQATIYYYRNGTTSSGVNKDVVAWKVYVADDGSESTVSLPSSMSMNLSEIKTITATTSSQKYSGDFKWQSSNHFIVEVLSDNGETATLRANSEGSTYIHVTLDNGNTDAVYVTVKDNELPTVSASPASGTYEKGTKIYLTASKSNATIRYTTDGSTPSTNSPKYSSYLTLNDSFTLKARAYNISGNGGDVFAYNYIVKKEPGVFSYGTLTYNILSEASKTVEVIASSTGSYQGDIVIPSSVKFGNNTYYVVQISENAFSNCSELTSIELPNTITTIKNSAFYGCSSLSSFTMPSSVKEVYGDAFWKCPIQKLYISDLQKWCSINFKENTGSNPLGYSGGVIFVNGEKLVDLVLPEGVTLPFAAFYKCRSIKSVLFPETFNGYKDGRWFEYCTELKKVTITKSVSKIPGYAFANCTKLSDVYCEATTPPILDTGWNNMSFDEYYAFVRCDIGSITLHVPKGCKEKYATAMGWERFSRIVYDYSAGVEDIPTDVDSNKTYEVYNLNGVMLGSSIDNLASGIYIIRYGSTVKKIVVGNK